MCKRMSSLQKLIIPVCLAGLLLGGCSGRSKDNSQAVNNVAGFLYHFDQRAETVNLVKFKNKGKLPVSVTWYYPDKTAQTAHEASMVTADEAVSEAVTEAADEALTESVTEAAVEALTESVTEAANEALTESVTEKEGPAAGTITTADPDKIIEIYNALNNVIVVGSGNNSTTDIQYYITFTLPDESTCTYEFISENTIRISDHNYTIESDGNLWGVLKTEALVSSP